MSNEEIVALLELTGKLLELHDENEFKIKNMGFATRALDKTTEDLLVLSVEQLAALKQNQDPFTKSISCNEGHLNDIQVMP